MMKKFYFAGSIRGGRVDAELYQRMISRLKERGAVLTEHVGRPDLVITEQGTDEDIYLQDTAWLRESDLLVAECTCPSLGVGYELAFAEKMGKPCHVFYNKTKCRLSAMIAGNSFFHIHPYETEEELFNLLDQLLTSI